MFDCADQREGQGIDLAKTGTRVAK
jgi:hypothetical protein